MKSTQQKSRPYYVVACLLWLTVGWRVDLLSIGGSAVRVDDLLIIALAPMAMKVAREHRESIGRLNWAMGLLVFFAYLSSFVNFLTGRVDLSVALLFASRPLEYWIIFLAAVHVVSVAGFQILVRLTYFAVTFHVAVAVLQYMGIFDIGFSKFSSERGAGFTAGPYELGAICVIIGLAALNQRRTGFVAVALLGILISVSRISLLAFVVGASYIALRRWRQGGREVRLRPSTVLIFVSITILVIVSAFVGFAERVVKPASDRLNQTSVFASFESAGRMASTFPAGLTSGEYQRIAYDGIDFVISSAGADASSDVRFFRWHMLLDNMGSSWNWFLGLGPSYPGPSVDGALLRILVETGFFGLMAWALLFVGLWRRVDRSGRAALLGTLVGSTVIDLPFAMRVAAVLLIVCATCMTRVGPHKPIG